MDLAALLQEAESSILEDSYSSLDRSGVTHYREAGEVFTQRKLAELFTLVVAAIRTRDLAAVSSYSEGIATERFNQGFDISEVQTAFNALETSMWSRVVADVPPEELAEATGLLSTVLGFAKDALARKYVSLASRRHVPSLDLSALFAGTDA